MLFRYSRSLVGFACAVSCAFGSHIAAHAAGLNDTGITDCWHDAGMVTTSVEADIGTHPRQDCRYGRDAAAVGMPKIGGGGKSHDFDKIPDNGSVLPASAALGSAATDWACTKDNVTGLIWEDKTNSGLRSMSHTFSWYNSNPNCIVGLIGASDLPTPKKSELLSIVGFGRFAPAIG